MTREQEPDPFIRLIDYAAAGTTVATIVGMLPSIAALFTIVWTGIRIWETPTIQKLFRRSPPTLPSGD